MPVLLAGGAVAAGGVAMGLRRLDPERIVVVAVLGSAFFVASLIHIPVGLASAHLILTGLAGVMLGWAAVPAVLVALLLQAVLFGYGGLTTLGANTVVMAGPAVVCHYLFGSAIRRCGTKTALVLGSFAGALTVGLAGVLLAAAMFASGREFLYAMKLILLAHVPVMVVEGWITGSIVVFVKKVRPELLGLPAGDLVVKEPVGA